MNAGCRDLDTPREGVPGFKGTVNVYRIGANAAFSID